MTHVWSLFSGIGGLDLGVERAGGTVVLQCEADAWRRELLAARFPGVPCFPDVAALRVEPAKGAARDGSVAVADGAGRVHTVPVPRLIVGGFPCQDVSVAGQRRGLAGNRTGLYFDAIRLVEAVRPGAVLLENVPGLFSSNGGRDFGVVIGTLADLGYGVAWRIHDSRYFGVPQRRRRVFICGVDVAGRAGADIAGALLAIGTRCQRHPATGGEEGPDVAGALAGRSASRLDDACAGGGQLISSTLKGQRGRAGGGIGPEETLVAAPLTSGGHPNSNAPGRRKEDDVNIVAFNASGGGEKGVQPRENIANPITGSNGDPGAVAYALRSQVRNTSQGPGNYATEGQIVRRLMPVECERLQGFPDEWTKLDDRTPDGKRYSGCGDAVTVPVAASIAAPILDWLVTRVAA